MVLLKINCEQSIMLTMIILMMITNDDVDDDNNNCCKTGVTLKRQS